MKNISSRARNRLLAAVASVAIAGSIGFGAVTTGVAPVQAQPVPVDNTVQVPSFADVVERVSPAVVSVRVEARAAPAAADMEGMEGFELPEGHPMERFFREFRGERRDGDRPFGRRDMRPQSSQGSGFFVSEDGYIVTNNHVVEGGTGFTVVTNTGEELDAKLIGTDQRTDLALLKVDRPEKFTYVDFGDDARVRVGDWVVAVGNPFGLGGTVTAGIVSARGRDIGAGPYDDFIQIDAAVNRGNSGGPAFNLAGEVVGVNTAIFSPSGGSVGIGFAIPATTARQVIEELKADGNVERGWLGVQIQPVDQDIAESLGLNEAKGALVSESNADTPAAKAGIRAGDVITQVNGQPVEGPRELARTIGGLDPNQTVTLNVWRDGKAQDIPVTLGEMPSAEQLAAAEPTEDAEPAKPEGRSLASLGLTVTPAEDGEGLVVTDVDPDSDAAERGFQAGDVITQVNSTPVKAAADVRKAIDEAVKAGRKSVLIQVTREDNNRFVAVPVDQG